MDTTQKNKFGLKKLALDIRDFSHHKKFGTLGASALPTQDFTVYDAFPYTIVWGDTLSNIANKFGMTITDIMQANPSITNVDKIKSGQVIIIPARPITILNQLDLDFCAAFTTVELQKLIYGKDFDPYYQMAKIKQIIGNYTDYGADLRDACNSVIEYGSLSETMAPFTHGTGNVTDKNRDFLANWNNYPVALDTLASKAKESSYFTIDGTYDVFDNIRSTLYIHRTERLGVTFGIEWHDEWSGALGGIIPTTMPASVGDGHDIAIIGQKTINGVLYLVFQQSWSPTAGNNGLYYFPRSIVDQSFALGYGAFIFSRTNKTGFTGATNWIIKLFTSIFK